MARRKITEEQPSISSPLTEKQERFVYLKKVERKTLREAYRGAFNAENMSDNSVSVEASRLWNDPKIALRAGEYDIAMESAVEDSLNEDLRQLARLREHAVRTGKVGAAVQAQQLIGKAQGHYVDQVRDVTVDPLMALREIAQFSPVLAATLAKEHGLEWPDVTEH